MLNKFMLLSATALAMSTVACDSKPTVVVEETTATNVPADVTSQDARDENSKDIR